jgi:uncharacterized membrane protein
MRQVIYAMRFVGHAEPAGLDSGVLRAATAAPSSTITSVVGPDGVAGSWAETAGGAATFASEVTLTGERTFLETGTIAFGDGNTVRFSTVGEGYLTAGAEPGSVHGVGMWQVDGGEGQFAGARGLITSNALVDAQQSVVDHQFGVIFVP